MKFAQTRTSQQKATRWQKQKHTPRSCQARSFWLQRLWLWYSKEYHPGLSQCQTSGWAVSVCDALRVVHILNIHQGSSPGLIHMCTAFAKPFANFRSDLGQVGFSALLNMFNIFKTSTSSEKQLKAATERAWELLTNTSICSWYTKGVKQCCSHFRSQLYCWHVLGSRGESLALARPRPCTAAPAARLSLQSSMFARALKRFAHVGSPAHLLLSPVLLISSCTAVITGNQKMFAGHTGPFVPAAYSVSVILIVPIKS